MANELGLMRSEREGFEIGTSCSMDFEEDKLKKL